MQMPDNTKANTRPDDTMAMIIQRPDNTITMERKDEKKNNSPQNTTQKTQDWATRSSLNTWVGLSELAHLKCMYLFGFVSI